jgi:hypothetical protein
VTLQKFIQAHRTDLDLAINSVIYRYDGKGGRGTIPDPPPRLNDEDRRGWILNDESLYNWARSEGVRI